MKKIILCLMLAILITGCTSKVNTKLTNKQKETTTTTTTTTETKTEDDYEIYTDDSRLVYKQGQTILVFNYFGDKVTGYKVYADYGDSASAKAALSIYNIDDDETAEAYTEGKYLVVDYKESEYIDMDVEELKAVFSYLEQIKKN